MVYYGYSTNLQMFPGFTIRRVTLKGDVIRRYL